jgi:hypothetical protein
MNNSQPADNFMPERLCYVDHTLLDTRLVADIDGELMDLGPLRIMVEYGPNSLGRIYVSPNYDEPIYDSNRLDSAKDSSPLT